MPVRVVNYGGGTNSTALLIEAAKRDIDVDLIIFADTGSEMPHTYEYLEVFSRWLAENGMPEITTVRWIRKRGAMAGQFEPLHEWCEREKTLPSKAFGHVGCTSKWKQGPADKYVRNWPPVVASRAMGVPAERWLGYDADEPQRWDRVEEKMRAEQANSERTGNTLAWTWRAPLIEWDMGRDECVATIDCAGLPRPGKSACFMCPSSKTWEIDRLKRDHPELLQEALQMERRAQDAGNLTTVKGLGRSWSWGEYLSQKKLFTRFPEPPDVACGCWDGD